MTEPVQTLGATYYPSPNFGPRRGGLRPSLVVVHYTAMPSSALALERLCDPVWEVSAHYLIARSGKLWSLVPETQRAWHAGAGSWGGQGDINSRSIGIEIDNDGSSPFTAAAMSQLAEVLRQVLARWKLPPEAVIGHSDMAPLRKTDPGRRFDWRWLARQGLSVWPEAADRLPADLRPASSADAEEFLRHLSAFGYPVEPGLDALLAAFRLRFRPGAAGPLCRADLAIAAELAACFPAAPPAASAALA